jgi:hypothetical protein
MAEIDQRTSTRAAFETVCVGSEFGNGPQISLKFRGYDGYNAAHDHCIVRQFP